jgi:two-component system LytT family response regulator
MIRCLVIDDEPLAQEIMENYINRHPALQLAGKCSSAIEAFQLLHNQPVDLMFLDIKMPGISGLDFIRSLKTPPAVIFTTAFSEYAVTGFELDAIDYLLKPITYERFEQSIRKGMKNHPPEKEERKDYTYFKVSGRLIKVPHNDILYAQSVKDYILLCTKTGNLLTHMTMKYLSELLPSPPFSRIHRSYLVNRLFVDMVDKNSIRLGIEVLPVGENYRENLEGIG